MEWNYRVVKKAGEGELYSIREVFYQENGSIEAIVSDPVAPTSETVEGLRKVLKEMLKATKKKELETHSLNAANEMREPNQW